MKYIQLGLKLASYISAHIVNWPENACGQTAFEHNKNSLDLLSLNVPSQVVIKKKMITLREWCNGVAANMLNRNSIVGEFNL